MRHLPSDKYNVAWFKLAEFVTRGEKERALGLYRLLIHSFDDKALAAQLEGDILLSFNDQAAVEKYIDAAHLYAKEGKITEAALVHEHILLLKPECDFSIKYLLEYYEQKQNELRAAELLIILAKKLIKAKQYEELALLRKRFNKLNTKKRVEILVAIVVNCCQENVQKEVIQPYLEEVLELFAKNEQTAIQQFMETLKAMREDIYQLARDYLADLK